MNNKPYFSIIVPVYKVERYLEQCVQSILMQTYNNFELIMVDDGSPDNCPQMCDDFKNNDERVKVIHKVNGGLSDARNFGLSKAQGEYILFLDSDDFWNSESALENIYTKLITTNVDVLIFGMQKYYQKENRFLDARVPFCDKVFESQAQATKRLIENNFFVACAWDKAIKASFIKKNGMRFVKGQLSEDIEWCCRILLGSPKIDVLSEGFYIYRQQNDDSITANIGRKNLEHICNVIKTYSEKGMTQNNEELLNFLAVQYVQWMTISNCLNKVDIQDLLLFMKKKWKLIEFHWNKRVSAVYHLRFLGFEMIRKLLGVYKKIK